MQQQQQAPFASYTIKPGHDTEIILKVAPGVICTLQQNGNTDKEAQMLLFSDPSGHVRMYVNPSAASDDIVVLTLQYEHGGKTVLLFIELRCQATETEAMPFFKTSPFVSPSGTLRPALTPKEITDFTNEELLARGYPLRPDATEAYDAYQIWKTVVSQATTMVSPGLIQHPYITCAPEPDISGNWSGYELQSLAGTYDWVTGAWVVPTVSAKSGEHDYSAIWAGLDNGLTYYPPGGSGGVPGDLVQAGTEQNCLNIFIGLRLNITIRSYYAWKEYLPSELTQYVVTGVAIRQTDQVYVQVWVGNNFFPLTPRLSGNYCFFMIENMTTACAALISTPVTPRPVLGATAEWITERPFLSGGISANLAKYGTFKISGATARNAITGSYVLYRGAPNVQIEMIGSTGTILSTAAPDNPSTIQYDWHAYE